MNREKKKMRFNVIDAVIILIILAIIAAAVYLLVNGAQEKQNPRQMGNMDFIVRIASVSEESLALFELNTVVKDSVTGEVIGEIVAVRSEKARYFGKTAVASEKNDGTYIVPVSEYEDKYDVYVTISTKAGKDTRGIHYVGDLKILIGSTVYFKIPHFTSIAYITDRSHLVTDRVTAIHKEGVNTIS